MENKSYFAYFDMELLKMIQKEVDAEMNICTIPYLYKKTKDLKDALVQAKYVNQFYTS